MINIKNIHIYIYILVFIYTIHILSYLKTTFCLKMFCSDGQNNATIACCLPFHDAFAEYSLSHTVTVGVGSNKIGYP